jgi:hypothetical protein
LAAINGELACLGDPLILRCGVEVVVNGQTLEARGRVPSEAIRAHVLKVASEASGMAVSDSLELDPGQTQVHVSTISISLRRAAMSTIIHVLPNHAYDIMVETWGNGQIVLRGKVDTYEEKLIASRCLRRLPGCTCVLNQLSVKTPYTSQSDFEQNLPQVPTLERERAQTFSVDTHQVAAEPESTNWALARIKEARATVTQICRWRPRTPNVFGQPAPTAETIDPKLTLSISEYTNELSARLDAQPVRSRCLPVEVLQIPVNGNVEPTSTNRPDEYVILASAKALPDTLPAVEGLIYPAELRDYITRSCGPAAKDVEVTLTSVRTLEIGLRADNQLDAALLSDQIIRLPELGRFHLSLTITSNSGRPN